MPQDDVDRIPTAARREVDVLVVGGGINGVGIARDLAGRGARVLLCEQDDLASHTSGASTKLIHGGLRYLEYYDFALVRKALAEREVLLKANPHIMRPLSFVMPHDPSMRPVWMIRIGLFLYDHLARREVLHGSRTVDLHAHVAGAPLKREFTKGFVYSDGWVDDARLVTLCAVDAAERGATVLTRTQCVDAVRGADHWQVRLRLVKGSHIVVRRLFDHELAYIFQNADGRIIFAIPYEHDFTLIGTTEVDHTAAIGDAHADAGEIEYLCAQASRYFARTIAASDVVWTYSGVRPLLDDEEGNPAAVTRDYRLELDRDGGAPLLSVWGGKITTFRKLAEEAVALLGPALREIELGPAWTETAPLPGGDLRAHLGEGAPPPTAIEATFARFVDSLCDRHPQLDRALVRRLARCYGTRAVPMLARGLGVEIAPGVFAGELAHLRAHEWARTGDDVLWRRTKLGLHLDGAGRAAVDAWMAMQSEDASAFSDER